MELLVDFNRVDKAGRVPARIPADHHAELFLGAEVTADDGEGTRCQAVVEEFGHNGLFVLLMPKPDTFQRNVAGAAPAKPV